MWMVFLKHRRSLKKGNKNLLMFKWHQGFKMKHKILSLKPPKSFTERQNSYEFHKDIPILYKNVKIMRFLKDSNIFVPLLQTSLNALIFILFLEFLIINWKHLCKCLGKFHPALRMRVNIVLMKYWL